MCEQSETEYLDGEVVWVKLGSCFWPGEVVGPDKLPPDLLPSFKKPPIAVVKFFQEETFEYVKNSNSIYKYNCSRKNEFINKGLYMYRTKHGLMEKFPEDVIRAETAVGGDITILTRDEFQEEKKESYAGLFGDPTKRTPQSAKKGTGKGRNPQSPAWRTPIRKIKDKTNYKVHILLQGSKTPSTPATDITSPSTSRAGSEPVEEKVENVAELPVSSYTMPTMSSSGIYSCHACPFTTTRLNVLIMHNKTHSVTFTPYTPSPARKTVSKSKSTPKTRKARKPKQGNSDKLSKNGKTEKINQAQKRLSQEKSVETEVKKAKTDEEIKSSLLADWDDVGEDSNEESTIAMTTSPQVPVGAESPDVPTSAELPSAQIPAEISPNTLKNSEELQSSDKPESSSDSKYEFCEDEDWSMEADAGRKIPRVKNPSKRKESVKSLSTEDDDVRREVAELLNKTTVPDFPSVPATLPVEENFPERSIVKSPDKKNDFNITEMPQDTSQVAEIKESTNTPPKTIFKTKTFFRSRHSRSQDAIVKYVAEQLNAERMDLSESEINGIESSSSPESRESPVELVKVAKLTPKIQLKRMKAEAAQQQEREKNILYDKEDDVSCKTLKVPDHVINITNDFTTEKDETDSLTSQELTCTPEITQENIPSNGSNNLCRYEALEPPELSEPSLPITANVTTDKDDNIVPAICQDSSGGLVFEYAVNREILKSCSTTEIIQENIPPNGSNISCRYEALEPPQLSETSLPITSDVTTDKDDDTPATSQYSSGGFVFECEETREMCKSCSPTEIIQGNIPSNGSNISCRYEVSEPSEISEPSLPITGDVTTNKDDDIMPAICQDSFEGLVFEYAVNRERPKSCDRTEPIQGNIFSNGSNISCRRKVLEPSEISVPSLPITGDVTTNKDDNIVPAICQDSFGGLVLEKEVNRCKEDVYVKNKIHLSLQLDYEQSLETRMTETAVDALLSVSLETDSVTRVISDDPPEHLFEDEKNNANVNIVNGYNEEKEIDDKVTDNECSKKPNTIDDLPITENIDTDTKVDKIIETNDETKTTEDINKAHDKVEDIASESVPTESDLQIAEALINLPSTAIKSKTLSETPPVTPPLTILPLEVDKPMECCKDVLNEESIVNTVARSPPTKDLIIEQPIQDYFNEKKKKVVRYETEQEKSENLNAAQSLVQMSECIDHNFVEIESENKKEASPTETKKPKKKETTMEPKVSLLSKKPTVEQSNGKSVSFDKSSSKLLKILEKPTTPKLVPNKTIISKRVIIPGKDKILNFDVGKQPLKGKPQVIKQNIVIRSSGSNKTILNNISEVSNLNKIILSRSNKPVQDGSSVQTYTIQTPVEPSADPNTILIQPNNRKIGKTLTKIQKMKPQTQTSFVAQLKEKKPIKESGNDEPIFDINSMPVVLSDDILTPESIEKMPIVMSDANIITNSTNTPKIKTKAKVESEKLAFSPATTKTLSSITSKAEIKTMVLSPSSDAGKVTTPNILSKSAKLRGSKPMLVIEKATGKKKIILPQPEPAVKESKQSHLPTLVPSVSQSGGKAEKYIILPTTSAPRATRTQKIVIDPQTGKAHMFLAKGSDALTITDNKAVSAKLIQQSSENTAPGNTVMIITNSQGAQSKIVLTPEHEKILFPHKAQLKTVTQRMPNIVQKPTVTTATAVKGQARIVPRNKSAIITSKGQLIVGGLVPSSTTNIAAIPEMRPALKRIVPAETKKMMHATHGQKNSAEQVMFYQRKPGTYMQLTAAQFEHFQKTGQLISKSPITQESKVIIQKPSAKSIREPVVITTSKQRGRKSTIDSQMPLKKAKQEIAIAPVPPPVPPLVPALVPALVPVSQFTAAPSLSSSPVATTIQTVHSPSTATASASTYPDLDNIEEILPSTAIARQAETASAQPEPAGAPATGALSDEQLLAVPGEHFGGFSGTFYLCVEDNGNYTIVDNRPLILENNELVPMAEPAPVIAVQPERRDILEAALANSDVFQPEATRDDPPDFRDLNANVPVLCRVSETSTTLNQPIMTPVEVPTKVDGEPPVPAVPANLDDGLAVIGVTPHTVPTSLGLPITVTDPRIAPKTAGRLGAGAYGAALLPSPNTEIALITSCEEVSVHAPGVMTLPLLADDGSVGKSLPILTDEVAECGVSSVESTLGSPSSAEVRDSEPEEGQWARRLLTPSSDTSEASCEIPLQPPIKLSVNDLSHSE